MLKSQPHTILFQHSQGKTTDVTIVISCYNYADKIPQLLNSLLQQTEKTLSVIITDDCSTDNSCDTILTWFKQNRNNKFTDTLLLRHQANQGPSRARNTALSYVTTPYTFILDADDLIYPKATQALKTALIHSEAEMAYSLIAIDREETSLTGQESIMGRDLWNPKRLNYLNYIAVTALINTEILIKINGYPDMPFDFGWEDYDVWCTFVDHGYRGCHVPQILCRYRIGSDSRTHTRTIKLLTKKRKAIKQFFKQKHHRDIATGDPRLH